MKSVADLLFEAAMLKQIPRSGYAFLGTGRETVAEHAFMTTFIAWVMAGQVPEADGHRLVCMCLVHDLAEARTGDLNYVNKLYAKVDENRAMTDAGDGLGLAGRLSRLLEEFNAAATLEAQLARDADQLSLIVDLKRLQDIGYRTPERWLPAVRGRLRTEIGRRMGDDLLSKDSDAWWLNNFVDNEYRSE